MAVEGARGLSRFFWGKVEFSKEWRGWSSGKMREGGETALLHRVARAAAVVSLKVWGVCPWLDREELRCTVARRDMQRRWYRSGVDSQVCMGRYIQKRLNSGQGEDRLKAAGGRAGQGRDTVEIARPLWHWAIALLPVPAAVKPRLAGFIFTREENENDEIRKIYRRRLSIALYY